MKRHLIRLGFAIVFFQFTAAPSCGSNVSQFLHNGGNPNCGTDQPVVTCVYFIGCKTDQECQTPNAPDTACQAFPICGTGGYCCPKAGAPCNQASDCCPGLSCKQHVCSMAPPADDDTNLAGCGMGSIGGGGGNANCDIKTSLHLHCDQIPANSPECGTASALEEDLTIPADVAKHGGSFATPSGEQWTVEDDCTMTVTVDVGCSDVDSGTWDPAAGTGTLTTLCPSDCIATTQHCTLR